MWLGKVLSTRSVYYVCLLDLRIIHVVCTHRVIDTQLKSVRSLLGACVSLVKMRLSSVLLTVLSQVYGQKLYLKVISVT